MMVTHPGKYRDPQQEVIVYAEYSHKDKQWKKKGKHYKIEWFILKTDLVV